MSRQASGCSVAGRWATVLFGSDLLETRAVQVLEVVATPAALAVLKDLAAGDPGALVTEAAAAVRRLSTRWVVIIIIMAHRQEYLHFTRYEIRNIASCPRKESGLLGASCTPETSWNK